MADLADELVELRKEVVESRNQVIKTDNQVKNLSLDIKGFHQQFESLERRTRLAGIGTHIIIALTVAVASYFAYSVQLGRLQGQVVEAERQAKKANDDAASITQEAQQKLTEIAKREEAHTQAVAKLNNLFDFIERKRDKEAAALVEEIDLSVLNPLELRLAKPQVDAVRLAAADAAYKAGKTAISASRADTAIKELYRYRRLDPEGRYAAPVRYLLAVQLWQQGRYDEMLPLLDEIKAKETDKVLLDEQKFFRAAALAHLGRRDEAKALLTAIAQGGGRYASSARAYLSALETGSELPDAKAKKAPTP